jgi:HTH-type transcriptional regulator/antitoxin HigA
MSQDKDLSQLDEPQQFKPIRTTRDYEKALARIEVLMDAETGSPEADELDALATLVELYENEHFPMEQAPAPLPALALVK